MIECNDLFDYGYKIYQNSKYFKFSLDSILLAEFIRAKDGDSILDLCTGNAPIPLILTTKNKKIKITAVELQKEIYELASKSISYNKLSNIEILNCDIKDYNPKEKFDIISCNPPYFKVKNQALMNENEVKRIARHEVKLNLEDVIKKGNTLLKETGTFYIVHRVDRLIETIKLLEKYSLGIRRICFVFTKTKSNAEFFLLEASKYKKDDPKVTYLNISDLKSYKGIFEEV